MTDYLFSAPRTRHLTHTKLLAYPTALLFTVFADLASYPEFSTSIDSSTVTSTDALGLPKTATLVVGYPPLGLVEEWRCLVRCDHEAGVVEVRNAPPSSSSGGGVLEVWVMRWTISPAPSKSGGGGGGGVERSSATVKVELEVKFRSAVVDGMFAVLPAVAEKTMLKFENRAREVDAREKERREAEAKRKTAGAKKTGGGGGGGVGSARAAPRKLEVRSGSRRKDSGVE